MQENHKAFSIVGIFIWGLACLYYFYEFFLRVFLSTIATDVMQELDLQAEEFAMLGSAYYLTYGIMQTPVGILVDKYGVRLLLSIACFICNLGVFGFVVSYSFWPALISRFLIGFGSSFAFVALLALALNWFPRKHFGMLTGLTMLLGAVGPFLAGAPLSYLLEHVNNNWRLVLSVIGVFGVLLNLLLILFIRTTPKGHKQQIIFLSKTEPLWARIKELIKNTQVWWIVIYAGAIYATLPLLGAFWGTTYLQTKGFDRSTAAFITSMMWLGLAFTSLAAGKFSDSLKRRKVPLFFTAFLGILVTTVLLYSETNSIALLSILFFLIGSSASGQSVSFATITEHVPKKLSATAIGLNNTFIMFSGSIIPPIASYLIQSAAGDTIHFTEQNFEVGLSIMPILFTIALLVALIGIKETYCRQQHELFFINR